MRSVAELEAFMEGERPEDNPAGYATDCLQVGEEILEHWIYAHAGEPTSDKKEGFRLLALQRQGSKGVPSFNACRETARELVYHYNLLTTEAEHKDTPNRMLMLSMVTKHLVLFVGGKLQVEGLGEFCCSSKGIRLENEEQGIMARGKYG